MTTACEPNVEALQQEITELKQERKRLARFAESVFEQTLCAQSGNALSICNSLNNNARQVLACPPDCKQFHPVQVIAWREGVSRRTVYNWLSAGGVEIVDGEVAHDEVRRVKPRN